MKVVVLYRPESEHERSVINFERDFRMRTGHEVELISLDSLNGDNTARLYDVTQYPAILAVDETGHLLNMWQGEQLPLIDEVSFYAQGSRVAV